MTLISPGPKPKQEEVTDRACKSPAFFREVIATSKATLRVRSFSEAESKGLKGASDNPSNIIRRSNEGTYGL